MAPKKPEPSDNEATEETVTVSKADLTALLSRIQKLETQAAEEIEISTDLPQAAALQPGQYVNIAPANQAPDLRKVRWTRATIEKTYEPVPGFFPLINITVAPHGIPWELHQGEVVTVPSIVKAFHDAEVQRIKHGNDHYKPESPMEILESIQRSKENPGQPIWGRPHIVGHGFNLGAEQAAPANTVPAPAVETKA